MTRPGKDRLNRRIAIKGDAMRGFCVALLALASGGVALAQDDGMFDGQVQWSEFPDAFDDFYALNRARADEGTQSWGGACTRGFDVEGWEHSGEFTWLIEMRLCQSETGAGQGGYLWVDTWYAEPMDLEVELAYPDGSEQKLAFSLHTPTTGRTHRAACAQPGCTQAGRVPSVKRVWIRYHEPNPDFTLP